MTTLFKAECECAVCGKTSEFSIIGSTNTFGGTPDLDLRPPEMQRSTMPYWVQECPYCGYVSESIDDDTSVDSEFLKSPKYLSCGGIQFKSSIAAAFFKYYMINLHDENVHDAFFAVLHAAWACDDVEDEDNAIRCRILSLPLVSELINKDEGERDTLRLVKADILRRAGLFKELQEEYALISFNEDLLNKILAFQLSLAENEDRRCYRISDVAEQK